MKRNNRTFRKSKSLLYRMSQDGDVYLDGTPVPEYHCVIVKVSDCKFIETLKNGSDLYNTKGAVCIKDMTGHSTTGMFYGKFKFVKNDRGAIARDLETGYQSRYNCEYYQAKIYLVESGQVYVSSTKNLATPKMESIFQIEQKEIKEKRSLSFPERVEIKVSTGEINEATASMLLGEYNDRKNSLA